MPDSSPGLPAFTDASTGQAVPPQRLGLRVLTLRRIAPASAGSGRPDRLFFSVEGSPLKLALDSSASVDHLPNLSPLLDDAQLDFLRRNYETKLVWCYGGNGASALTDNPAYSESVTTPLLLPVRVRRIVRLNWTAADMTVCNQIAGWSQMRDSEYMDDRPLLVVLDSPFAKYSVNFAMVLNDGNFPPAAASPAPVSAPPGSAAGPDEKKRSLNETAAAAAVAVSREVGSAAGLKDHVLGEYLMAGDAWDFERHFSLVSPHRQHPEWPRRVLREIASSDAEDGMTHDMIAWIYGWPAELGTLDHVRKLPDWTYDAFQGDATVHFSRSGRVTGIDQPELP